jgi:hypothetical protein
MTDNNHAAAGAEGAAPAGGRKRVLFRGLVDHILNGTGTASAQDRALAFGNAGLAPPLDTLIGKVATRPVQVSDADFATARSAGYTEDQLFELVVCAAVGESERRYEAGLAALAHAAASGGDSAS